MKPTQSQDKMTCCGLLGKKQLKFKKVSKIGIMALKKIFDIKLYLKEDIIKVNNTDKVGDYSEITIFPFVTSLLICIQNNVNFS